MMAFEVSDNDSTVMVRTHSYEVKYRTSECSMPVILSSVDMLAMSATEGFAPFVAVMFGGRKDLKMKLIVNDCCFEPRQK